MDLQHHIILFQFLLLLVTIPSFIEYNFDTKYIIIKHSLELMAIIYPICVITYIIKFMEYCIDGDNTFYTTFEDKLGQIIYTAKIKKITIKQALEDPYLQPLTLIPKTNKKKIYDVYVTDKE